MKKSTISFEAVIVAFVMPHHAYISVPWCYFQICTPLFLFLYRGAGLRDVRPPFHNGRRAGQQGERPLYAGFDNRMMKPKMKRVFLIIDTLLTCLCGFRIIVYRNYYGEEPDENRRPVDCLKDSKLGIRFVRAHWPGVYPVPQTFSLSFNCKKSQRRMRNDCCNHALVFSLCVIIGAPIGTAMCLPVFRRRFHFRDGAFDGSV